MSESATSEIPSSGGSTEFAVEHNTVLVVLGASGDLSKKKVSPLVLFCLSSSRFSALISPALAPRVSFSSIVRLLTR